MNGGNTNIDRDYITINGGGKNRNRDGNTMNGGIILSVSASAAACCKTDNQLIGGIKIYAVGRTRN